MRNVDRLFIEEAEKLTSKSACHYKLGAVLVKDKEVLSTGYNKLLSMDKVLTQYGMFWTLHAEMDTLRKLYSVPKGATLYVARNEFRSARPCKNCIKIIKKAGIKRIVYSTGDGMAIEKLD